MIYLTMSFIQLLNQSIGLILDLENGKTGLHLLLLQFQSIDLHFNIFLQAILNLFSHL